MPAKFALVKIAQNPCWYCEAPDEDLRCGINELTIFDETNSFYLQVLYSELESRCDGLRHGAFARFRNGMRGSTAQERCRTRTDPSPGGRPSHLRSILRPLPFAVFFEEPAGAELKRPV